MVTHPDVIISKPRKLIREAIGIAAALICTVSGLSLMAGAGGALWLIIGIVFAIVGTRVKYRYVRRATGSVFELD